MKEQRLVIGTALAVTAIGILCICARVRSMRAPSLTSGESLWRLTYDIRFHTIRAGGRIRMGIPDNTGQARILRESFSHSGLSMDLLRLKHSGDREAVIVPIAADESYQFTAQFDIHLRPESKPPSGQPTKGLTADERARYLQKERDLEPGSPQVGAILNDLARGKVSKDELLKRIFDYCCENIAQADGEDTSEASDASKTLEASRGSTLGRARAMVALCRAAKVPARLATGFIIRASEHARPHFWVEVYDKDRWVSYDPEYGYAKELPTNYLVVRHGGAALLAATQEEVAYEWRYSIGRLLPVPALGTGERSRPVDILNLTRLSWGMQHVIALILLLPTAALITAIFRNIIGIRTYGTFAPALLALSFVRTDWRIGAVVFVLVLAVGLAMRVVLNRLKLHMVVRLSIILTCVVLCLTLAVSTLDYLELTPSARAVLLPMVILTMMIERFNVTAEEDGLPFAIRVFIGTVVVAACCLVVLEAEGLSRLVLIFPEGQCFVVAALLLIGRYSGYRLNELWRFRDIAAPGPPET